MKLKRVAYSICVAIVITVIAYVMSDHGIESLILPGVVINLVFNWVMLLIPTGEEYYTLPSGAHVVLNVAFYTSIVCAALFLFSLIRDRGKKE